MQEIRNIPRGNFHTYLTRIRELYYACNKLLNYTNSAKISLLWQSGGLSTSVYKPYWKIDLNGYIWYVTQEGKALSARPIKAIIKEIKTNQSYLRNSLK